MKIDLPLEKVYHWEKTRGNEVFLRQPIDGQWRTWTWKQTMDEARRMAAALRAMNLPEGSRIAMISKNCAHWVMCDLAMMMSGHVSVPLYPNLQPETLRYTLEHSGADILFVGKLDTWDEMKSGVPDGVRKIGFPFCGHTEYENWDKFTSEHEPMEGEWLPNPEDLCSIIYTSGTTGNPKGVMQSHYNFGYVGTNAIETHVTVTPEDRFFSYLPLCHIAERCLVEMGGIYSGGTISFAQSLDTFAQNLAESRPTIFLGVPRIWAKFQQGILGKMPQERLDLLTKIPLLGGFIKTKIRKGLGLNDARLIYSGAAAIPKSLIEWFWKLDIKVMEAYAMTENCCYSHVTLPRFIKIGSVGQPMPHCEVRINEGDEEIQIRHGALMTGYYKDDEKTAEAFTADGYLRTGDAGRVDSDNFLFITGRVKALFKTDKGKYVAPEPIELKLEGNENIAQACVVGTGIPQPIGLVTVSEAGKDLSADELRESVAETLAAVNKTLDKHEVMKTLVLVKDDWVVENGMLTPTMKLKRREVEKRYGPNYLEWYGDAADVVME